MYRSDIAVHEQHRPVRRKVEEAGGLAWMKTPNHFADPKGDAEILKRPSEAQTRRSGEA